MVDEFDFNAARRLTFEKENEDRPLNVKENLSISSRSSNLNLSSTSRTKPTNVRLNSTPNDSGLNSSHSQRKSSFVEDKLHEERKYASNRSTRQENPKTTLMKSSSQNLSQTLELLSFSPIFKDCKLDSSEIHDSGLPLSNRNSSFVQKYKNDNKIPVPSKVEFSQRSSQLDSTSQKSAVSRSRKNENLEERMNNLSIASDQSANRQLSSTLRSNQPPELFKTDLSVIRETSHLSERNDKFANSSDRASTFNDADYNAINNIRLSESAGAMAKKFLQNANNKSKVSPRQPTALEALVEQQSIKRPPRTTSTSNGYEIAIKPDPISNWGFVAIGDEVQSKILIQNQTSQILEVMPILTDSRNNFTLTSNDTVYVEPKEVAEFGIIFAPKELKRYRSKITFVSTSSGNHYSHTLFGYGGTADVKIVEKSSLSYFPRSSIYRYSPQNPSSFTFEVENVGLRSSFVHISPMDDMENETRMITVTPDSFCLIGKGNDPDAPTKMRVTVKVSENYMQQMNRMSLDSVGSSSSSSTSKGRFMTLKVYFGDERLRQRAEKYSTEIDKHQTFHGLLLTKTAFLLNGEVVTSSDRDPVTKQDIEILKAQTRVLTMIVGDDRMSGNFSSSRPSSFDSRPPTSSCDGFYVPKLSKNCEDSVMSNGTFADRTYFK